MSRPPNRKDPPLPEGAERVNGLILPSDMSEELKDLNVDIETHAQQVHTLTTIQNNLRWTGEGQRRDRTTVNNQQIMDISVS